MKNYCDVFSFQEYVNVCFSSFLGEWGAPSYTPQMSSCHASLKFRFFFSSPLVLIFALIFPMLCKSKYQVCIQAKWLSRPGPLYRFHLACVTGVRKGGKGERRACIAPDFSPSLSFYGLRRRLDFTGMKRLRIPPSSCKFAGIHLYTLKSHLSYLELSALPKVCLQNHPDTALRTNKKLFLRRK